MSLRAGMERRRPPPGCGARSRNRCGSRTEPSRGCSSSSFVADRPRRGCRTRSARCGSSCSSTACSTATDAWWRGPRSASRSRPRRGLAAAHDRQPHRDAVPRSGDDRGRSARRAPAGVGREHRAPRAARVPRPAAAAARAGVPAQPHLQLAHGLDRIGRPASSITLVLLGVDPARRWCCSVVFAVPDGVGVDVAGRGRAPRPRKHAAPGMRLARHLFDLGTSAGPGKEIRVDGTDGHRRRPAPRRVGHVVRRGRRALDGASAAWHTAAWTLFGLAYVGAVVFVASGLDAPPGDVVLALAAGANLSRYLGVTVGQAEFLRWTLDAAQRLVVARGLREHASRPRRHAGSRPAARRRSGSSTCRSAIPGPIGWCSRT